MLPIQTMLIKYNFSKRAEAIKYIAVHDTGNTGRGAGVDAHFNFFNGADRNSSADYFVDDEKIGMFVEPHNKGWHVGDGGNKYGINNNNALGVEICINSDGDYNKAVDNTVDLVKHLMKKHNVPVDRVVRHYDASRKQCPNTMSANNWSSWHRFKARLTASDKPLAEGYNATAVNINSYLMVRPAPGSSTEIGKIYNNERVHAFEEKDGFRRVVCDTASGKLNLEGWCTSQYIKLDEKPKEIYRVRESWDNPATQKGAFSDLANAKVCCDENPGTKVFNNAGQVVYAGKAIEVGSKVKITGTHYATGQPISEWAKKQIHTVGKIDGDKALLSEITSWVYLKDLALA